MSIRSYSKLETITAVMTHVRAAINLAKAMECQTEERTLCIKRKVLPNQNFEKQFKFFSTKKKWMSQSPVLTKPSFNQSEKRKEALSKTNSLFCGSCFKENDMNYENQEVQWIQCDNCSMWLHLSCTQPTLITVPDKFICHFCV